MPIRPADHGIIASSGAADAPVLEEVATAANSATLEAITNESEAFVAYNDEALQLWISGTGTSASSTLYDKKDPDRHDFVGVPLGTTATPAFHFDASMVNGINDKANPVDGEDFAPGEGGGIWTSRTGSVVTAFQGTASAQPTYHRSGTNGQPYFDYTADHLAITPVLEFDGDFTYVAIMEGTTGHLTAGGRLAESGGQGIVWVGYSSGKDYFFYDSPDTTAYDRASMPSATGGTNEATYDDILRMYMVARSTAPASHLYVDGNNRNTSMESTDDETTFQEALGTSGAAYQTTGHIYEIIAWSSDLSTADKNAVISYVNSKYWPGRSRLGYRGKLNADVSAGAGTVQITGFDAPNFPTTGSAFIKGDVFSWTGKTEPSATIYNLTGVTGLSEGYTAYTAPGNDTTSVVYESTARETF